MVDDALDAIVILCLSEAWIIPMWSYYPESHAGLVVGLNYTHSFFSDLTTRRVHYTLNLPGSGTFSYTRFLLRHWSKWFLVMRCS